MRLITILKNGGPARIFFFQRLASTVSLSVLRLLAD